MKTLRFNIRMRVPDKVTSEQCGNALKRSLQHVDVGHSDFDYGLAEIIEAVRGSPNNFALHEVAPHG